MSFPWYEIVNSPATLNQGDLIKSCPVLIPPSTFAEGDTVNVKVVKHNVVVLSQSCDLVHNHIDKVLVCLYMTYQELVNGLPERNKKKGDIESLFKKMRMGIQPNYHLLDKDASKGVPDYLVVDFRNVFSVDVQYLATHANQQTTRLRLCPPYREQLSQAFAKFFMRVGLPQDISDINGAQYL